ncbi:MAG: PEP-CTERM sorting domain-containing protein [Acidobacteriia bacterium]|nr:PEP-CTERM sorting domain-containing protein [Terriglobia bacterium]
MRLRLPIVLLGLASAVLVRAGTVTINFDDGTAGNAIGSFYAAQGLTFSNAGWTGLAVTGITGLGLVDITDDGANPPFTPTPTTPIVGVFSSAQSFVSILAGDVGIAGAKIDVYDAVTGGNLIGSDSFFGTGTGAGQTATLSVSGSGILRFELYRPAAADEGLAFDNLTFSAGSAPVPEPSTLLMIAPGGALLALLRVRKRS